MSRLSSATWALVVSMGACALPAGAQTQARRATLGDFIASQRVALEAEVNKIDQEAARSRMLSAPPPVVDKPLAEKSTRALEFFVPPEPKPTLLGIMGVGDRRVAEIGYNGRTMLLASGQTVSGSQWRVAELARSSVTLQRPSKPVVAGAAQAKGEKKTPVATASVPSGSQESLVLNLNQSPR